MVLEHLHDHQPVISHQQRAADPARRKGRLAEEQLLQRWGGPERGGSRALLEGGHVLNLQSVFLRECVQVSAGLLELALQLLLDLPETIGRLVTTQLRLEIRTCLLEGLGLARLDLIQANDVITELRLHRACDLAHLHGEQRIRKGLHEACAIGPAQVAAVLGRARIL